MTIGQLIIIFYSILFTLTIPYFVISWHAVVSRENRLSHRISLIKQSIIAPQLIVPYATIRKKPQDPLPIKKIIFFTLAPIPSLLTIYYSESIINSIIINSIYASILFFLYGFFRQLKINKSKKIFSKELPNSIDLVMRSLRAGRTILESLRTVSTETEGPVANVFKDIVDQCDIGRDFISIVNQISKKLNIPEFSFFVIVLSVQQETGGNAIKILSSLANMLRQREMMRHKIKALSAEGILSAFFMGSLPILVGGAVTLLRPDYIMVLFTDPSGQHLLAYGVISELIGCALIAKMIKIDV